MHGNRIKVKVTNKNNSGLIRLSVLRSNAAIYAALIDDSKGVTLTSVSSRKLKKATPIALATQVGKLIAEKARDLKIDKVVFDRNNYKYHGRVKALADGARDAGLKI